MGEKKTIDALVEGGKASPAPPLGPALGQLKVNVKEIIDAINEKTKAFAGMKVPIKVTVDVETKEFSIEVGTPPTSQLIKNKLKIEKLSQQPGKDFVGNLSFQEVVDIAKMKKEGMLVNDLKAAVKNVIGTCVSAGVTIDGKDPKRVIKEVEEGKYDDYLKE
ncbi:MAG: 50S ribosomal protein L11 [Candidatus Nanohaloarchaeota archaeon]|nr:50S ribosomal protein L11 [Candidatus Nanohaloarchaeota archaeon]